MGGDFFQGGGGGLALILSLSEGELKLIFVMRGGVWLSFGTYFTHFPIPPPGNYCTVPKSRYGRANRAGSIFKQSLSYRWQAHIQKLHNRVIGASLNIIVMWGGLKLIFVMRGGVWLSFGTYFTHFPIPPPGNYCTVPKSRYGRANRAGSIFKQSLSYRWQAHIQKLHNRVKCSREYSTSAAFETKLGRNCVFLPWNIYGRQLV